MHYADYLCQSDAYVCSANKCYFRINLLVRQSANGHLNHHLRRYAELTLATSCSLQIPKNHSLLPHFTKREAELNRLPPHQSFKCQLKSDLDLSHLTA